MTDTTDRIAVLHVEDDRGFAELAAEFLERVDDRLAVRTAHDAGEAREVLSTTAVDCVVSDYDMPEETGIDLLEWVRSTRGDLPFVLFTGKGSEEIASEAISAGVTDYLQKGHGTEQYTVLANRLTNAVEAARSRERVARQERISGLVREINRRLVAAETTAEIEAAVCETIADSEPYLFAWIGEPDHDTGKVAVRTSAGDADEYLEAVEIRFDDTPRGRGPAGRAIRSGEPQVAANIPADDSFEPWRAVAERYGYASVVVLPLRTGGNDWGVLAIYADRPNAFEGTERAVLEELADTVGDALGAAAARAELEAREAELERYETILESLDDGVYAVAPDDTLVYVNERYAAMKGVDRDRLLGTDVYEWVRDDVREEARAVRSADDDETGTIEYEFLAADGESFPAELRFAPVRLRDERLGRVGVIRDVSERKRREERLRRQNERLEEFAGVVSHDLRNPLRVAMGAVELAAEECETDHHGTASRALDRMDRLIEDLLALAREGESVIDLVPVDLGALVDRCWADLETGAATLVVETDRRVRADEGRLRQLLENLLGNAVTHGRRGSGGADGDAARAVTVRVGDLPDGFYVADDGPGIPADERDLVFDAGHTTDADGTGFGLAIVQRIADTHGWSVRATEGETGGARIEVTGVDVESE